MKKQIMCLMLLLSLTTTGQTNVRVFKGDCQIKKQVSIEEYSFLCEITYITGYNTVEKTQTVFIKPAFSKDSGTFSKGNFHERTRTSKIVKELVPIVQTKIVVVEKLPYAVDQFDTPIHQFRSVTTTGISSRHLPSYTSSQLARKPIVIGHKGRSYTGVFAYKQETIQFEGNTFPVVQYQHD